MSTRVVDRVDDWDEQSFSDGYSGLHDLADREFSGVVRAGGAELFMTKGVVVGIRRGTIEDFEDAAGTTYIAPTPALPLLAIMQERSEEVRAQYYTEDTSIAEVDRTLEDGGFTGFVELSENVLSGDYYLVYHRGRSMSVAYVGNSKRLIQDDDAFDQANDEVGIYEVRPVDIEAIEIPEPKAPEPADDAPTAVPADAADSEPEEADASPEPSSEEAVEEPDDPPSATEPDDEAVEPATEPTDEPTATEPTEPEPRDVEPEPTPAATDAESTEDDQPPAEPTETEPETTEPEAATVDTTQQDHADARTSTTPQERSGDPGGAETRVEQSTQARQEPASGTTTTQSGQAESTSAATESATRERATPESPTDLETKSIPSLDPELTQTTERSTGNSTPRGDAPGRAGSSRQRQSDQAGAQDHPGSRTPDQTNPAEPVEPASPEPAEPEPEPTTSESEDAEAGSTSERVTALQSEVEEKQATIAELETELQAAETARDEARADLATVQEERDELEREVERLQSELTRLEEELGAKMNAERRITPQEALDGTDIFVRYHSKGKGTLEKAHDSGQRREDVTENLRLEKHTQFDADAVSVGGQTYDEFLESRVEFNFVEWVVKDLLFEIQSTGHTETLQDLYDSLPKINRVELNGVVTAGDEEEGETRESFDIVFRARMGDPLLVANINESRQGASQSMMESLITAAERVGKTNDAFASAFLVTESFFEPEALETVADATRGGLLSRDKRKSFVNLSRKRGYHLCLVEARNENFHLEVPEL